VIERSASRILGKSQTRGGIGLGITIDEKCSLILASERSAEINGRCSLTYATFLIGNGNNSAQSHPLFNTGGMYQNSWHSAIMFHVEHLGWLIRGLDGLLNA
jgi:hypothetical protein